VTDHDLRIFVDATRPATLNDGVGSQTDFATLEAAVVAWRALPSAKKIRATVKVIGGRSTARNRSSGFTTDRSRMRLSERAASLQLPDGRRRDGGARG
jgi:hypothetical protein